MGLGHLRTDVDAVVVPVTTGHVLVDVGVDARHLGQARSRISDAMRIKEKGCWRCPRGCFRRGSLLISGDRGENPKVGCAARTSPTPAPAASGYWLQRLSLSRFCYGQNFEAESGFIALGFCDSVDSIAACEHGGSAFVAPRPLPGFARPSTADQLQYCYASYRFDGSHIMDC